MDRLLTRDNFREAVFSRDNNECVICKKEGKDAHHIIERRLFPDGGYYINNGATLCYSCHIDAEMTLLSVEEIREAANIRSVILPPHLYSDVRYDKWTNVILPNGKRCAGELFQDESVQKILKQGGVLDNFTQYVKYPRTLHLPFSPGRTKDDRILDDCSIFVGHKVVVTEKYDGENSTLYRDYIHARSVESAGHPSQTWSKRIQADVGWQIPEGWRVCAENLQAKHSIKYTGLPSYLLVFSIWDESNTCLSWSDTIEYVELLGLKTVPVLYVGEWDEDLVKKCFTGTSIFGGSEQEGYVVRLADSFHYSAFKRSLAKYVRPEHVTSVHHWKYQKVEFNDLANT